MKERCTHTLGRRWRWLGPLARRVNREFAGKTRPRRRDVAAFLAQDEGFADARRLYGDRVRVAKCLSEPQRMQPVGPAKRWAIQQISTTGEVASWLGVSGGELEWFADLRGLNRRRDAVTLQHYSYRVVGKKSGSVRLIEAPKGRLKRMQQQILAEILDRIPAHEAVHGFVKGRSIKTFAAPHANRTVVLRMDMRDFFPSFPAARVAAYFRTAGYPERVADRLAGICTNAVPLSAWPKHDAPVDFETRQMYLRPHLPQGAPTSPALANGMAYRMDCRLSGLARAAGAVYTRYADDLAFSGDAEFARGVQRFAMHAMAVAMEEGFEVHARKTRVMRQGVRQSLAGLVVNREPNVGRAEFDRLKAILTNCVRHGRQVRTARGIRHFASICAAV